MGGGGGGQGGQGSGYGQGNNQQEGGNPLSMLRRQMAAKLGAVNFKEEAERERVKLVKGFSDQVGLLYDILEEEKEMQCLQLERKKLLLVKQQLDGGSSADEG